MNSFASRSGRFGLVTLIASNADTPPFEVDAEIVAQDRWLVMDDAMPVEDSGASYDALGRSGAYEPEVTPGQVLVRRGPGPVRLWAVIHDLDAAPTCRREWVEEALRGVLEEATRRGARKLRIPALGCDSGAVLPEEFPGLLASAVRSCGVVHRLRIWISVRGDVLTRVVEAVSALRF